MKRRLSLLGIGPRIALVALTYALLAGAATHRYPDICRVRLGSHALLDAIAVILVVSGIVFLVVAARSLTRAYNRDTLATWGAFGLVRHPIYSAWIVFILPGIVLPTRSWPLFLTPLVAYAAFKLFIPREDQYLQERFGDVYLDYRSRVNELFPIPSFRRRAQRLIRT
jgi:protein-S-isoprenylcysteine O-methyltransferase Ste14